MTKNCFVTEIKIDDVPRLRQGLIEQGFEIKQGPHLIFHASKKGIQVHLYQSLKLTVMGKEKDDFIVFYLEPEILKKTSFSHPMQDHDMNPHIGSDEAGKGDYFGPLCIASVSCDQEQIKALFDLKVEDSKNLSDEKIHKLAEKIKDLCAYEIVIIYPKTYNELYSKFKNLNRLLAWAHHKALEGVFLKSPKDYAIIDQFSKDALVQKTAPKSLKSLKIIERTKAESDLVVAAASILARDAFVTGMKKLSEKANFELPKGASSKVVNAAKQIVERDGKQILNSVAKMHFKTTLEVLGAC
jgi:ribonuclease HIII